MHIIVFIVAAGTPAARTTIAAAASVGLPIAYATFGWLGRVAILRVFFFKILEGDSNRVVKKRTSHVMAYALLLGVRILMDVGATIYYEAVRDFTVFSLSSLLLIFSMLSIGLRPLMRWVFPCSDPIFLEISGFCKDSPWAASDGTRLTFNPHFIYVGMVMRK